MTDDKPRLPITMAREYLDKRGMATPGEVKCGGAALSDNDYVYIDRPGNEGDLLWLPGSATPNDADLVSLAYNYMPTVCQSYIELNEATLVLVKALNKVVPELPTLIQSRMAALDQEQRDNLAEFIQVLRATEGNA